MSIITDYPERLLSIKTLYLGEAHEPYVIEMIQRHQADMLIKFEGLTDRDQSDVLQGEMVYLHLSEAIPLEDGEVYLYQLQGMNVVTDQGELLGEFSGYLETGANDVYIVTTPDGREILLPAIGDVVKEVNLQEKKMVVHLLDGLIE